MGELNEYQQLKDELAEEIQASIDRIEKMGHLTTRGRMEAAFLDGVAFQHNRTADMLEESGLLPSRLTRSGRVGVQS